MENAMEELSAPWRSGRRGGGGVDRLLFIMQSGAITSKIAIAVRIGEASRCLHPSLDIGAESADESSPKMLCVETRIRIRTTS